jgi:putative tryptophan/tyrosine transport system substrate-binding protein
MFIHLMNRRALIAAVGGAAAWPVVARAQKPKRRWRIGMLETIPPELNKPNLDALRRGLQELGYVESRDYVLEYRSADGQVGLFPRLAAELVQSQVDIIVTRGTPAAQAAKSATSTIPIVMAAVGEALGVVERLAHPGGNVTGMSAFTTTLAAKRVELLKQLLPDTARIAYLHNMSNPVALPQWEQTEAAALQLGIDPELYDIRSRDDISRAIATASAKKIEALFVGNDSVTQENRSLIAELAIHDRLPTVYGAREFVEAGGLMSYSVSYPQLYYESARLVDKILQGTKAGDLPVAQPTTFSLVINLKTAKVLGLAVTESFLLRADEVIE